MTAAECLTTARAAGPAYQRVINAFVDDFRRAGPVSRRRMVQEPLSSAGCLEGLIAAVVSPLCRETGTDTPDWVGETGSPEPFFPFPAGSLEMRLRLMIESPPPFRIRRVFGAGELPVEGVSARQRAEILSEGLREDFFGARLRRDPIVKRAAR